MVEKLHKDQDGWETWWLREADVLPYYHDSPMVAEIRISVGDVKAHGFPTREYNEKRLGGSHVCLAEPRLTACDCRGVKGSLRNQ